MSTITAFSSGQLERLHYYAMVVRHGGFSAAARALGLPKSRLSRQVNALEAELGVRLLQRSTRRFVVTEIGQQMFRHCEAMLAEAEAAVAVVESARAEPRGRVRVASPVAVASSMLAPVLPRFLARFPQVRVDLVAGNRRVDLLGEGFDAALRVRSAPSGEDGLVMRSFAELCELLVASPAYLQAAGEPSHPRELERHPALVFDDSPEGQSWQLRGPGGEEIRVEPQPRLCCHEFGVLLEAARAGLGIALLPESVVRADLAAGTLRCVLPSWSLPQGIFHVVFPHRRGLLPAVRAFIDFLAEEMPRAAAGD